MEPPFADERPLPTTVFRIELLASQVRGLDSPAQIDVVLEHLVQRDRLAALAISLVRVATSATAGGIRARLLTRDRLLGVEPIVDEASVEGIVRLAREVIQARLGRDRKSR